MPSINSYDYTCNIVLRFNSKLSIGSILPGGGEFPPNLLTNFLVRQCNMWLKFTTSRPKAEIKTNQLGLPPDCLSKSYLLSHVSFSPIYLCIYVCSSEPETAPLPGEWDNACNELQRMLIVRSLRPDRVAFCATSFIVNNLGSKFTEPPVLDMQQVGGIKE